MPTTELRLKRETLGVAILLILGSLYVVFPFLDAIILAGATSYFLKFGHKNINETIENEFLSSLIIIAVITGTIFLGTFTFVQNFETISTGASDIVQSYQQETERFINNTDISPEAKENLKEQTNSLLQPDQVRALLTSLLASLPSTMIHIGIFLFVSLYLFKDWNRIERKFYSTLEKFPENEEKIIRTLIRSIDSIFRGVFLTQFTVAAILGVTTAIGFWTIGFLTSEIPFTIIWSLLVGIAALLPLIAAFMIYGPLGFYYLFFGEPVKGLLILGFGFIILNILPEIFLRPYIGSKRMDEHPLIIFVGFIAGPLTLGIKGLIIGPIVLILAKDFVLNYSTLVSPGENQSRTEDSRLHQ